MSITGWLLLPSSYDSALFHRDSEEPAVCVCVCVDSGHPLSQGYAVPHACTPMILLADPRREGVENVWRKMQGIIYSPSVVTSELDVFVNRLEQQCSRETAGS